MFNGFVLALFKGNTAGVNLFKNNNTNINNNNNNNNIISGNTAATEATSDNISDTSIIDQSRSIENYNFKSEDTHIVLQEEDTDSQSSSTTPETEEDKIKAIERLLRKTDIKPRMSTKSYNFSPNTLIPSVSKTFISQFNLAVSQNESSLSQSNKLFKSVPNNNNNSNILKLNQIFNQDRVFNAQQPLFDIFSIPTEMLVHLLSFLKAKDLWKISVTCKRIWQLVDTFKFWDILFEKSCPRIYFAMQFNSRWSSPTPHQAKMVLCLIDSLPSEYYHNFDASDENGQIKKVIGVMKEHLLYPTILRETCYILKRLSYRQRKEDEHESLIARYGGIKLILSAMKMHPFDSGVQEDACGALGNLTCDSPNNLGVYSNNNYLEVVEQGGIALILSAMRNHLFNPGVQYNTSFVLRNLARNDISESRVAQEGGIQAIATAMKNHPNHIGIQTQGCGALRNLGCNDSNKILSAREGGITLILKAMRVFSSHPDLQLNGCGALRNLARNEDNKNMISKQGGIQLVLSAMTNHPDDPDVQDEGCAALINLAYQDENNEETIAQEGGINLILRAMKNHPYHSGVQMQGRGALKNLSCNPKNKLVIARSGGIELMNLAIHNHPTYSNRFLELMRILQAALDNI